MIVWRSLADTADVAQFVHSDRDFLANPYAPPEGKKWKELIC